MKKTSVFIAVFIGVFFIACTIAWVGGFNFDKRHPDVAFGFFFALLISLAAAALTVIHLPEDRK